MKTRCLMAMTTIAVVVTAGCSQPVPTAPSHNPVTEFGFSAQSRTVPSPKQPISIVQGAIVVDFAPSGSVSLRGTRGFTFEAPLRDGVYPGSNCRFGFDCVPGSEISLHGFWVHPDLRGVVTLQGQNLTDEDDFDVPSLSIEVFGTVTAPAQATEATVTAPFMLAGTFSWDSGSTTLEGRGIVTVFMRWEEEAWQVGGARYDFRGR